MKKLYISFFIIFLFFSLSIPAFASPRDEETTQDIYAKVAEPKEGQANVVITSDEGVQVLTLIDPTISLEGFLASEGYKLKDFRNAKNKEVSSEKYLDLGETIFLFKVEYDGAQQKLAIPYPTIKREVPAMLPGETKIAQEGKAGEGIITTVTENSLAGDQNKNNSAAGRANITSETLTVVTPPTPKIVLVGSNSFSFVARQASSLCTNGSTVPTDVDQDIINIHAAVCSLWPDITSYGTWRAYCTYTCDHHDGIAVDIMVTGDEGWQVAYWLVKHYKEFNINNIIYSQHIWSVTSPSWEKMEDRGSITQNHYDHVHVSVFK